MYKAANLLNKIVFVSIAFPVFSCVRDDAEINIVERDLKSAWSGAVFLNGIYLANILLAVEFKGY